MGVWYHFTHYVLSYKKTFHEIFNIRKFWSLKKNVFKIDIQHKFTVIGNYGNEQTESNIIKIEDEKEFQQRLDSRKITPKYKNTQKIIDRMFDTCSSMSKVQNNQLEITKDEVQLAIKTLPEHKCHDTAGLKNEVLRSGGVTHFSIQLQKYLIVLKRKTTTRTMGSTYSNCSKVKVQRRY